MKVETVLYNSTLALLAIVLIIYLVMSLLPSTKDKFVSDVTKINLQAGNKLLEESCYWENRDNPTPSGPPVTRGVLGNGGPPSPPSPSPQCSKKEDAKFSAAKKNFCKKSGKCNSKGQFDCYLDHNCCDWQGPPPQCDKVSSAQCLQTSCNSKHPLACVADQCCTLKGQPGPSPPSPWPSPPSPSPPSPSPPSPPSPSPPSPSPPSPPPWLSHLPPTMAAVFSLLFFRTQHGNADSCSKLSPEQVDALSAPISVSKLQAEQFYLNNSIVIDQIYKVKTNRECFQSFVNVLVQLEANHKRGDKMASTLVKYGVPFLNCVKKLSLTERENVINLIISLVMSEVKSVPRKILEEYLI